MNRFEALKCVGEGTYGIILKCRNRLTNEIVAVKRFKHINTHSEYVRCVMMRELRIEQLLKGEPHIAQLLEAHQKEGQLFLVMEYIPNNLLDVLSKQSQGLPLEALRMLMYTLLLGVRSCHTHGIVHRDIKPENVLIKEDGTAVLCDFGFSRPPATSSNLATSAVQWDSAGWQLTSLQEGDWSLFPSHNVSDSSFTKEESALFRDLVLTHHADAMTDYVSTRWYRSPEMLLGLSQYDFAVDVWALGAIMSEATDGEPLFPGNSELEQLFLIQNRIGDFPPWHQGLLQKRYGSAAQLHGGRYCCTSSPSSCVRNCSGPPSQGTSTPQVLRQNGTKGYLRSRFLQKLGEEGLHLLTMLLAVDAQKRITVDEALKHPFFARTASKYSCPRSPVEKRSGMPALVHGGCVDLAMSSTERNCMGKKLAEKSSAVVRSSLATALGCLHRASEEDLRAPSDNSSELSSGGSERILPSNAIEPSTPSRSPGKASAMEAPDADINRMVQDERLCKQFLSGNSSVVDAKSVAHSQPLQARESKAAKIKCDGKTILQNGTQGITDALHRDAAPTVRCPILSKRVRDKKKTKKNFSSVGKTIAVASTGGNYAKHYFSAYSVTSGSRVRACPNKLPVKTGNSEKTILVDRKHLSSAKLSSRQPTSHSESKKVCAYKHVLCTMPFKLQQMQAAYGTRSELRSKHPVPSLYTRVTSVQNSGLSYNRTLSRQKRIIHKPTAFQRDAESKLLEEVMTLNHALPTRQWLEIISDKNEVKNSQPLYVETCDLDNRLDTSAALLLNPSVPPLDVCQDTANISSEDSTEGVKLQRHECSSLAMSLFGGDEAKVDDATAKPQHIGFENGNVMDRFPMTNRTPLLLHSSKRTSLPSSTVLITPYAREYGAREGNSLAGWIPSPAHAENTKALVSAQKSPAESTATLLPPLLRCPPSHLPRPTTEHFENIC